MAISVPIDLPHRNVFLSYNYEYNYYLPEHVYKFPPILVSFLRHLKGVRTFLIPFLQMGSDFEDSYLTYPTTGRECKNCTVSANSTTTKAEQPKKKKAKQPTLAPQRRRRSMPLMSRKTFYTMLRDKLDR